MSAPQYMTPHQAAASLGVTRDTIVRWILRGDLPARRTPGGRYLIARDDLLLALGPARQQDKGTVS